MKWLKFVRLEPNRIEIIFITPGHDWSMVSTPQQPSLQNPRKQWFQQNRIPLLILLLIITIIIISGLFYQLRSGPIQTDTPHAELYFDTSGWGLYGGFSQLSEVVNFKDVRFSIKDESLNASASLEPLVSHEVIEVSGGMNASYFDANGNERIDGVDQIRAFNWASGDIFEFTYIPTGGTITKYTVVG
jgi:hypothetical protein